MKLPTKAYLLAVVTAAAGISAGAATYNGDLFIGFTTQFGKDVIYDIGQPSSLFSGQTWNLNPSFGAAGITSVGNVKWGVLGDQNVSGLRFALTTTVGSAIPPSIPNTPVWGTLDTATRSIASQFTTLTLGQSVTPDSTFNNSWNQQTIAGTLTTQYHNAYENPNVTGLTTASLYRVAADGSAPEALGSFSLAANGTVSFVPEPSTYALLGIGVLAFSLRRRFFRQA